jgi:hypothetical protein
MATEISKQDLEDLWNNVVMITFGLQEIADSGFRGQGLERANTEASSAKAILERIRSI